MHKLKDKVSREVAKMYKDLEFTVRADSWGKKSVFKGFWGDDSCCLGGDEHVDGQGGGLQGGGVGHQGGRQDGQGHDRG